MIEKWIKNYILLIHKEGDLTITENYRGKILIDISNVVKLVTVVESDQKAPLLIATTPSCRVGRYSFPLIPTLYP